MEPEHLPSCLHFSSDESPGYRRVKRGQKVLYLDSSGASISDQTKLARIASLVIPPAWTDVWICTSSKGHLQVTGRDAKNRKQAIYHPKWHEIRSEHKFDHLKEFGSVLPKVREAVEHYLGVRGHSKEKVLAAIVQLLDSTMIRIGNLRYEVENKSYGLTTLRNKHVKVIADKVEFKFVGKSSKPHQITIRNRTLSRIVRQCQDLPGQHLFTYTNSDFTSHEVTSTDVNSFLQSISSTSLTAKEFRTWGGSVEAVRLIREYQPTTQKQLVTIVREVAEKLGNTPAVCRQSYIHPKVLNIEGTPDWITAPLPRSRKYLDSSEVLFLDHVLD